MLKFFSVIVLIALTSLSSKGQGVTSSHNVTPGSLPNEYIIKTTISGLEGVDLARIKYFIPKTHTYKASSNNQFFSKVETDYIKFYIMSIPTDGIVIIELGVVLANEGSFTFPVEFQYSKNEEKIVFECKPLLIENGAELVAEEPTLNDKIQAEAEKEETELAAQQEEEARLAKVEADKKIADDIAATNKAKEEAAAFLAATQIEEERKRKEDQETAQKEEAARLAKIETDKKIADDLTASNKKKEEAAALIATTQAEETRKKKADQEAQKLKEQQEVDRLAHEKEKADALAKKEAEAAALLTAARKEKEANAATSSSGVKYGVQIFALSKYTEQKVRDFCKRNNISYDKISTLEVKGITKIRYGSVNTKKEAEALKKELLKSPQINGGFVIKVSQ